MNLALVTERGPVRLGATRFGQNDPPFWPGTAGIFVVVVLPGLRMLHRKAWRWCSGLETHPLDEDD